MNMILPFLLTLNRETSFNKAKQLHLVFFSQGTEVKERKEKKVCNLIFLSFRLRKWKEWEFEGKIYILAAKRRQSKVNEWLALEEAWKERPWKQSPKQLQLPPNLTILLSPPFSFSFSTIPNKAEKQGLLQLGHSEKLGGFEIVHVTYSKINI